ncbi:MAG: ABC transporter ATP-binding protein [Bacilli bacterium]|nr:ABC transporter ATP-binding protein [Bacilli bacterium]
MLKLKNVSKFYYNKGVIASGFSKVNISFDTSEFVVITGESGSGKSTLLNVISGLDSYEEGEMYINGEETSHYRESDFEEYRKKYVSNIFQNFNLVNSYTVYQNVELVLLLNGYKKKEVKKKILELIDKVGLSKYKNTKVSKLSGGQKQRVAIARALAKDTPIIVCDEPTGNLDSKSSKDIIKILKEVSKNKLLIMVTHDYASVEDIATRVIKMHDGKIVSDKKMVEDNNQNMISEITTSDKKIGFLNMIRLGIRNTFNIIPKFILTFIVFLFITVSLLTEYGSLRKSEYESGKLGYNWYFMDTSDTRIIINKKDGSFISEDDFERINKINNVDKIVENDIILDNYLWFESTDNEEYYYFDGILRDIEELSYELDYGRMPESDNEVVLYVYPYDYNFNDRLENAIKETYYLNSDKNSLRVKVVGIVYQDTFVNYDSNMIYGTSGLLDKYMSLVNIEYSERIVNINSKNYPSFVSPGYEFHIAVSDKVSKGKAIVSEGINYTCKDFNCKNKNIEINISNLYYEDSLNLKISNIYNEKTVKSLLGIDKNNSNYGSIFINKEDYNNLFNKESYQASIFVTKVDYVDDVVLELEDLGYRLLEMRKTLSNEGKEVTKVIKIVKLVVTVLLVITLFFISYFVIKLILKSRNVYFSTLRILGSTEKNTKRILDIELFINSTLAYFTYIIFILLVKKDFISINFIKSACEYLSIYDYVLMYIVLVLMSYLISSRFSSKIFKKSAMNSYREEV